jgi:hypothetical protein
LADCRFFFDYDRLALFRAITINPQQKTLVPFLHNLNLDRFFLASPKNGKTHSEFRARGDGSEPNVN